MSSPAQNFKWAADPDRLSVIPIQYPDIWHYYNLLASLNWTPGEVNLSGDKYDWDTKMSEEMRKFVKHILAFFSTIDSVVLSNLDENFGKEFDLMEVKYVYIQQAQQEAVHAIMYGLQIQAVTDGDEQRELLNAARNMPIIVSMYAWVKKWFDKDTYTIGERLVAFAAVEGVLFSFSFSALQWLREMKVLSGITQANEFIMRDEGAHTDFACMLISKYLQTRPSRPRVLEIIGEIIEILDAFIDVSMPDPLPNLTPADMHRYIRFQADYVINKMGYGKYYKELNPFAFMDKVAMNASVKVNFFESRSSQYQSVVDPKLSEFTISCDDAHYAD